MEAIVMAAGEGLRLRPVTERWPKPILPIDGRPVVATVLRELRAAGCDRVTVVTGYLAEQVERLLGDGSGFGLELRYARQPRPDGSADAVSRGLAAGAEVPLLVATADTVFQPAICSVSRPRSRRRGHRVRSRSDASRRRGRSGPVFRSRTAS
jgi:NDP-sugar pyrophosphorylase family protein